MNIEHRDPLLESLFASNPVKLEDADGQAFTAAVMSKTRRVIYGFVIAAACLAVLLIICAWLMGVPIRDLAQGITDVLAIPLFDLGDGWVAWVFTPINNIASLLVLSLKLMRVIWKKVTG